MPGGGMFSNCFGGKCSVDDRKDRKDRTDRDEDYCNWENALFVVFNTLFKSQRMLEQALENREKYSDDFVRELGTRLQNWRCLTPEYETKLNTMDVFDELSNYTWYHTYIEGLYYIDDGRYQYDVEDMAVYPSAMAGLDGYEKLRTYAEAKKAADRGSF